MESTHNGSYNYQVVRQVAVMSVVWGEQTAVIPELAPKRRKVTAA